eukprot:928219-Pelagomonas_calceolata.AAC.5
MNEADVLRVVTCVAPVLEVRLIVVESAERQVIIPRMQGNAQLLSKQNERATEKPEKKSANNKQCKNKDMRLLPAEREAGLHGCKEIRPSAACASLQTGHHAWPLSQAL